MTQHPQPQRDLIVAIFRRIGEQPDLKDSWEHMPNAERNAMAGDFYNILTSHTPTKSEQKQCAYWGCKDGKNCCSLLIPDPALYVELTDIIRKDEREKVLDELVETMREDFTENFDGDLTITYGDFLFNVNSLRSKQGEQR